MTTVKNNIFDFMIIKYMTSKQLEDAVHDYVLEVINGFESGLYKMVRQTQPLRLELLASPHHPFITIARDFYETYFTKTFNSIIKGDDLYVTKKFDEFQNLTAGHSKQCMLNILSNMIISIHFNIFREKLDYTSYERYMESLRNEIVKTWDVIDVVKLFNHSCQGVSNDKMLPIPDGEKFIVIKMTQKSNDVKKKIHSFSS